METFTDREIAYLQSPIAAASRTPRETRCAIRAISKISGVPEPSVLDSSRHSLEWEISRHPDMHSLDREMALTYSADLAFDISCQASPSLLPSSVRAWNREISSIR